MRKNIMTLLGILSVSIVLLFMTLSCYLQVKTLQRDMVFLSRTLLQQVENVILKNEEDMQNTLEENDIDCLSHARAAAYMIQQDKSQITDVSEMQKIADLLQVDEIHVFNKEGVIWAGSVPKYFGYTMESGEQMRFFLPMLSDTSMELSQQIMPNTAEGKEMKYTAVWLGHYLLT